MNTEAKTFLTKLRQSHGLMVTDGLARAAVYGKGTDCRDKAGALVTRGFCALLQLEHVDPFLAMEKMDLVVAVAGTQADRDYCVERPIPWGDCLELAQESGLGHEAQIVECRTSPIEVVQIKSQRITVVLDPGKCRQEPRVNTDGIFLEVNGEMEPIVPPNLKPPGEVSIDGAEKIISALQAQTLLARALVIALAQRISLNTAVCSEIVRMWPGILDLPPTRDLAVARLLNEPQARIYAAEIGIRLPELRVWREGFILRLLSGFVA